MKYGIIKQQLSCYFIFIVFQKSFHDTSTSTTNMTDIASMPMILWCLRQRKVIILSVFTVSRLFPLFKRSGLQLKEKNNTYSPSSIVICIIKPMLEQQVSQCSLKSKFHRLYYPYLHKNGSNTSIISAKAPYTYFIFRKLYLCCNKGIPKLSLRFKLQELQLFSDKNPVCILEMSPNFYLVKDFQLLRTILKQMNKI